jgi:phage/plasmid-associated DNA primase
MWRRVIAVPFVSRFLSEERYEQEKDLENTFLADPYFTTEEFHNEYKQVMFLILAEHFKGFQENHYTLKPMPEECKKLTMDYLAVSDNIFDWFNDAFEKEEGSILTFKEIYETFKEGEFYNNMTKQDKRTYNQKYFYEKLEKNIFLRKFIKRRGDRIEGVQLGTDSIVGWGLKTQDN